MVHGGGEIHCGPGTPGCEIWPDTRPTGTRQTALASVDAQSPRGLKKQEQRPDYIVIDDLDDDEMSHNEERIRQATDWVKARNAGQRSLPGTRSTGTR